MTANLFNGRVDAGALARVLDDVRPDVVACQELSEDAAEVIAARLPHGRLEPRDDFWGGGIAASREVDVTTFPVTARDGWTARLYPTVWPSLSNELVVAGVHYANPIDRPVRRSLTIRRGQLADTLAFIGAHDGPLVLVGDFNSTPLWPAYRRLVEHITDGVAVLGRARRTWGPWWWFPRLLRIDHVFVRAATVATSRLIRVKGMDHSALVVDVDTAD